MMMSSAARAPLPTVESLRAFLQARFPLPPTEQETEVATLWRESPHYTTATPIEHLTLALDFRALPADSMGSDQNTGTPTNALFLHRPFDLPVDFWPGVPVFASHRGLDAHLSVGWNPALAQTLLLQNMTDIFRDPISATDAHPIGMVGDLPEPTAFGDLLHRLSREFGGMETVLINGRETVERLAVMGAMTPALIQQASEAGAQGYLTGQVRDGGRNEAVRCGLAVFATGHKRAEWWGLHQLARELTIAFPGLQTLVVH